MDYKNIKVKGENGRYTEEFKDAIRDLCRKGLDYSQINEKLGVVDLQFNSGYRQLFWKLRREVEDGVQIKQLKANNSSSVESSTIKETNTGVVTKSEKATETVTKVEKPTASEKASKSTEVVAEPVEIKPIKVVDKKPTLQLGGSLDIRNDFVSRIYSLKTAINVKSAELELLKSSLEMYESALADLDSHK